MSKQIPLLKDKHLIDALQMLKLLTLTKTTNDIESKKNKKIKGTFEYEFNILMLKSLNIIMKNINYKLNKNNKFISLSNKNKEELFNLFKNSIPAQTILKEIIIELKIKNYINKYTLNLIRLNDNTIKIGQNICFGINIDNKLINIGYSIVELLLTQKHLFKLLELLIIVYVF